MVRDLSSREEDIDGDRGEREAFRRILKSVVQNRSEEELDLTDQVARFRDENGRNLLWWAAALGNVKVVKKLVEEYSVPLDVKCFDEITPMEIAAQNGYTGVVRFLQMKDADRVINEYKLKDYFACTVCGLLRCKYERFAAIICPKNRDHVWDTKKRGFDFPPAHIKYVRAENFQRAKAALGKPPHAKVGWWNRANGKHSLQ